MKQLTMFEADNVDPSSVKPFIYIHELGNGFCHCHMYPFIVATTDWKQYITIIMTEQVDA